MQSFQRTCVRSFAVLALAATFTAPACNTVQHYVVGPEQALVTIPGARGGQDEQHLVEASANGACRAGVRAIRNQDWPVAITAFRQALLEDDIDAAAHFGLGVAYEMTGRVKEALVEFESATTHAKAPNASYVMSVERAKAKLGR